MKNIQDEFEKKFRDRFSGFEEEPDDRYFAAIRQQTGLPKFPFRWQVIAGALVAVITTLLVWQYSSKQPNKVTINPDKKTAKVIDTESGKNTIRDSTKNAFLKNHETEIITAKQPVEQTLIPEMVMKVKESNMKNTGFYSLQDDSQVKTVHALSEKYSKPYFINQLSSKQILPNPAFTTLKIPRKPRLTAIRKTRDSKPETHFFYLSLTPVMSYYHISPDKNDAVFISRINAGKVLSAERSGFKMQAGFVFPVHEKIHLRAGILYSRLRQNWQYSARKEGDTLTQAYAFSQLHYQIGIKADAMYRFAYGLRWSGYALAGPELQKDVRREGNSPKIMSYWHTGAGFSYRATPDIMLFAEPDLSISLNRFADDNHYLKVRPYHFGINAGVVFSIQQ